MSVNSLFLHYGRPNTAYQRLDDRTLLPHQKGSPGIHEGFENHVFLANVNSSDAALRLLIGSGRISITKKHAVDAGGTNGASITWSLLYISVTRGCRSVNVEKSFSLKCYVGTIIPQPLHPKGYPGFSFTITSRYGMVTIRYLAKVRSSKTTLLARSPVSVVMTPFQVS
ncbi:hypothetical protein BIW11_11729 [Tropilaelaps mercedesae]|uniref:Uncharacterized protein n=1 Tax=Tropilaelaps mercedesae TaxID=418985 RepID=A0A1V9X9R1_9ACAR|nr:hypothetical protein BIW11_11729 [Tropilaelaps mercedesae]